MPYVLVGNCVHKQKEDGSAGETVPGGCHDTEEEAKNHMQALYANVKDSAVVEMSMRITKASYNKSEPNAMRWSAIDSDVDDDLYQEKMSIELYKDFVSRIENKTPIPEPFAEMICESDWCGGVPYLSIAHYKAGTGRNNVPGDVESVYIDGTRLKSKGVLHNSELGRAVWEKLREDMYIKEKSTNPDHQPVRISIGFLDLEHKHLAQNGGQEFTFVRKNVGEMCPLCVQGIGGKIYMKGQLVHLAMTRVPVNPRTEMVAEKSMGDEIQTKKDDAKSIVGELAETLEEKSFANDVLVVRSEDAPQPADMELCDECYDPNTNSYNQDCVDRVMEKYVAKPRADATVKSKALFDAVQKSITKISGDKQPVVEETMANETTVAATPEVDKGVLGIPEKKFEYAGVSGDGNNNLPNPVKAKDEEAGEGDEKGDEMEKSFVALRKAITAKSAEGVNEAFQNLGTAVEKEFQAKSETNGGISLDQLAEVIRSAVQPLQVEIATLKAQLNGRTDTVSNNGVVKSRALNIAQGLRPEDLIQRSVPQPQRKLTKIQEIAYRSTGAI